jgi:peptide/nickel transport system substrate-binding protein
LDRNALATTVFAGSRQPLLSPIPNEIPGYVATLPQQNIAHAQALLLEEGFTASTPLPITLSFVNDGRYSNLEEAYANAIKAQLEETGIFQVTVSGAPWDIFSAQIAGCNNSTSLLGWPSPGRPTNYLDASAWTDFFITSTAFCPNYESEKMTDLLQKSREELDLAARAAILAEMQTLWTKELPTLDILQEPRIALSQNGVRDVAVDAMGLLHYELLTKGGQ